MYAFREKHVNAFRKRRTCFLGKKKVFKKSVAGMCSTYNR